MSDNSGNAHYNITESMVMSLNVVFCPNNQLLACLGAFCLQSGLQELKHMMG